MNATEAPGYARKAGPRFYRLRHEGAVAATGLRDG